MRRFRSTHLLLAACAGLALAGCETVAEETAEAIGNEFQADLRPIGGGGGSGRAEVTINDTSNQICTDLEVSGIGPVTAAHIHGGTTGAVYFDVEVEDDNDSDDCDSASDDLLDYMRRNPGAFYVDVHTSDRPDGALRGRIGRDRGE